MSVIIEGDIVVSNIDPLDWVDFYSIEIGMVQPEVIQQLYPRTNIYILLDNKGHQLTWLIADCAGCAVTELDKKFLNSDISGKLYTFDPPARICEYHELIQSPISGNIYALFLVDGRPALECDYMFQMRYDGWLN